MREDRIYIRHGESEYNKRLTASLDSQLTDDGVLQIRAAARFLQKQDLGNHRGFCTPYLRCLQSARIIRELTGLEFRVLAHPREVMTCYDSVIIPNRSKEFPDLTWQDCPTRWEFFKETDAEFNRRMKLAHEWLGMYRNIVVISHGTPINTLYELDQGIVRKPDTEVYPRNASITRWTSGNPVCYNKLPSELS